MPLTRRGENGLQARRDAIHKLNADIVELEALRREKDSPLWKLLGPKIAATIDANRAKMETLLSADNTETRETGAPPVSPERELANAKLLAGAIAMARHIQRTMDTDELITDKRERIERLTKEITEIQDAEGI